MYLAHISEDKQREQSLVEHLKGTAKLAGEFAGKFGSKEWGVGCGICHDIGKYSDSFQRRLQGGSPTDHSTAGAKELHQEKYIMAAYCVAGHHAGLPDGGTIGDDRGESTFYGRMKKQVDDYTAFKKEIEFPKLDRPPMKHLGKGGFSVSFFIRMLFSCLVDGDFLDTEIFMSNNTILRSEYDTIEVLLERLLAHVKPWLKNSDLDGVNERRTEILNACLKGDRKEQGLYQLTVPTGGGKTISSLAFALSHAKKHHLDRIIYVIPYTSIIEQNAAVFKEILGSENVLEDHYNVSYDSEEESNKMQRAAENWDKPIVVTTNVQFFESLFSNKTSKCRKLHNIANSVVIFDEAQMLPTPYLKPCINAMSELLVNYHSTIVLCTATQPTLQELFPKELQAEELCPNKKQQFSFFQRTSIEYAGEMTEDVFIERIQKEAQVLCILNNRRRVQRLYDRLKGESVYHLSTLMYPLHRKRLLKEIREKLKSGEDCILIATSLVEAGVDFDFGTVYRELAGIDSVIQAAGRCNREGKKDKKDCITHVFEFEKVEGVSLPNELKLPIAVAKDVVREQEDISSLEAITSYFQYLYKGKGDSGLDKKSIVERLENGVPSFCFPFASVAKDFRLIENDTKTIFITLEQEAIDLEEKIKRGQYSREIMRRVGHYCVTIYEEDFNHLYAAGKLKQLDVRLNLYILYNAKEYSKEKGLNIEISRGVAVIF